MKNQVTQGGFMSKEVDLSELEKVLPCLLLTASRCRPPQGVIPPPSLDHRAWSPHFARKTGGGSTRSGGGSFA